MASITPRAGTASLGAAIALAVVVSLSGCFGNPIESLVDEVGENASAEGAEKLIEGLTGGVDGGIDVELGGSLPEGFPESIPLVEGELGSSMRLSADDDRGEGWLVSVLVPDAAAAVAEARELLLAAGFEETLWNESPPMTMGAFSGDAYGVLLNAMADPDTGGALSYTVVQEDAAQ